MKKSIGNKKRLQNWPVFITLFGLTIVLSVVFLTRLLSNEKIKTENNSTNSQPIAQATILDPSNVQLDSNLFATTNYHSNPKDIKGWKKNLFSYSDYNLEFYSPQDWTPETSSFSSEYLWIKPERNDSENRNGLFLGDGGVFSTSGTICGNSNCSEVGTVSFNFENTSHTLPIIYNRPGKHRFLLEHPLSKKNSYFYITASFADEKELQTILNIVSTIKIKNN